MANTSLTDPVILLYECLAKRDLARLWSDVFAPDVVWRLPGRHPLAGTLNGAREVGALFEQLAKSSLKVERTKIAPIDEDTVVEEHTIRGEADGTPLEWMVCSHYRIRDGKIIEVDDFICDQEAADVFFHAAYRLKPIPDRLA